MHNYKIIENRPELTSSQIIAGMNFGVVKAGALATKVTIAGVVISKTIISKGFVAAAVLASSALVYKSYTAGNDTPEKNRPYVEETVSAPGHYGEGNQKVAVGETINVVNTMIKPMSPPNAACQPRQITPTANMPQIIPAKDSVK